MHAGLYSGSLSTTGDYRIYPEGQDLALIMEEYLYHTDAVTLLRDAGIPVSNSQHNQQKHTLVKKFLEFANDPPTPMQILQVRFLDRHFGYMPQAEDFGNRTAIGHYISMMWPSQRPLGDQAFADFDAETRGVLGTGLPMGNVG